MKKKPRRRGVYVRLPSSKCQDRNSYQKLAAATARITFDEVDHDQAFLLRGERLSSLSFSVRRLYQ